MHRHIDLQHTPSHPFTHSPANTTLSRPYNTHNQTPRRYYFSSFFFSLLLARTIFPRLLAHLHFSYVCGCGGWLNNFSFPFFVSPCFCLFFLLCVCDWVWWVGRGTVFCRMCWLALFLL